MSKKNKNRIISAVIAVVALIFAVLGENLGLFDNSNVSSISSLTDSTSLDGDIMTVTFVDVGQGDCEFIEFPSGECLLIDCGEKYYSDEVIQKIKNNGYSKIDSIIVTHPHTDHMGGMSSIIDEFEIGEIYMPYAVSDTNTYQTLLETIDNKGMTVNTVKAGMTVTFSENITGEFLAPNSDDYSELNNYSAVLKLTYNDISFLFTGDAENLSENEMLENYYSELDSDVLKVGHHGSNTASGEEFLYAVSPEYAVIECGTGNSYGHPHSETLDKLENIGAQVYRTDLNGDTVFKTNGSEISIED